MFCLIIPLYIRLLIIIIIIIIIIIDECDLDGVKSVFLQLILTNVSIQIVNNGIKRNKKNLVIQHDCTHARTHSHVQAQKGQR